MEYNRLAAQLFGMYNIHKLCILFWLHVAKKKERKKERKKKNHYNYITIAMGSRGGYRISERRGHAQAERRKLIIFVTHLINVLSLRSSSCSRKEWLLIL